MSWTSKQNDVARGHFVSSIRNSVGRHCLSSDLSCVCLALFVFWHNPDCIHAGNTCLYCCCCCCPCAQVLSGLSRPYERAWPVETSHRTTSTGSSL
jgi:hypothetical protein